MKDFFENPAEKIQKFAQYINIVSLIFAIGLAILWLILGYDICNEAHAYKYIDGIYYEFNTVKYISSFVYILFAYIIQYIVCLRLYGFAELIKYQKEIVDNTYRIKKIIETSNE